MVDKITEINIKDLPLLRDLYKLDSSDKSKNYTTYITIDTYIRWFQQGLDINCVKFYCLNGNFTRGTFVVVDCIVIGADTLDESTDELKRLVSLLDFSKEYYFIVFSETIASAIRDVTRATKVEITRDYWNIHYLLPKEKALEFDIKAPDGIELRPITQLQDLEKAYKLWPMSDRNPFEHLLRTAKYNPNMGAFTADGTLVAWMFRRSNGLLLNLGTDKDHRRYGYGSIIVKALAKKVAELGQDPYATIFEANTASRTLFVKNGFREIGKAYWIFTKAVNEHDH